MKQRSKFCALKVISAKNIAKIRLFKLPKSALTLLTVLFFTSAFSQSNFIPASVTLANGESLAGFIDYKDWDVTPRKISFKENIDDKPIKLFVTEVREFRLNNEIFERAIVQVEYSSLNLNNLDDSVRFKLRPDTVFLQTIYDGAKSLYYLKMQDGKELFYIKVDSTYTLLLYKKYRLEVNHNIVVGINSRYKGQLAYYLNDCRTITANIDETKYTQHSLYALFKDYYKCSSAEIKFQQHQRKLQVDYGAVAGISITHFAFSSSEEIFAPLVNAGYKPSLNFSGGFSLDLIFPNRHKRWSVYNELFFTSFKTNGYYNDVKSDFQNTQTWTEVGASYIKINNNVRYKYPIKSTFVFLQAGISSGFMVGSTNYRKTETQVFARFFTEEGKVLDDFTTYEQAFSVGAGMLYKKASFQVRYESGNGIINGLNLLSSTKRLYFLLGYTF